MEEKYAMNEIDIIIWSNKIDLLALSNAKGNKRLKSSHFPNLLSSIEIHRLIPKISCILKSVCSIFRRSCITSIELATSVDFTATG